MLHIVQDIIEAEREAKATIEAARERVRAEQASFEEQERLRLQEARERGEQHLRERTAAARAVAEAERARRLDEARARSREFFKTNSERIDAVVEHATQLICEGRIPDSAAVGPRR